MKDKGFTLIELLAVIVILAIIALIAVPIIIDIIEDSKEEALKRSAENYLKAVELAIAKENLNREFNPDICNIEAGVTKCGNLPLIPDKILNVTVDGELPKSGTIKLQDGTIVRDASTFLTYDKDTLTTLTYDENNKLGIKKQTKPALKVVDNIVYYVPAGSTEAIVYGYRGDIDYSDPYVGYMSTPEISGDVVLQSTIEIDGKTYPVTSLGVAAFTDGLFGANITSITIPEGVTSIGQDAFSNCSNLSSVTIPSSMKNIDHYAFTGTPWFTSQQQLNNGLVIAGSILIDAGFATGDVEIPPSVISIGSWAFASSMANSVTIPSSVTTIDSNAFCNNLFIGTINIYAKENSIEGAPWASYATINWLG
ncbi:MAG: leucine-rich repeat domain-containing protein [bacterium]|nr:leucine-rich repeat domain-containing protein [bacterium]